MLHGGAWSLQYGDAFYTFFNIFTIILQAADGHARFQKGEFYSELLCVLIAHSVE